MKIHPLTDADLERIRARLSRIEGDPSPVAAARRLMRLGFEATDEAVALVLSFVRNERVELDPAPNAPAPAPKGRKPKG